VASAVPSTSSGTCAGTPGASSTTCSAPSSAASSTPARWPRLRSTNPLERFNREIGRRTDVVGIFPDDASLVRLVSMLAIEANDCHEGQA
jgi:transposase-like protein